MLTKHIEEPLTEAERKQLDTDLDAAVDKLKELEDEKAAIPKRITSIKLRMFELRSAQKKGTADREIEVDETFDYAAGIVTITRKDTGEKIDERKIRDDERQVPLRQAEGIDRAEEQAAATPDEAEEQRQARIDEEVLERFATVLKELKLTTTCNVKDAETFVVRLETPRWFSEVDAATEREGKLELAAKVLSQLEADATEIRKLAGEQAADAAKDKPRRGLQVPKNGPTPIKRGRIKVKGTDGKELELTPDGEAAAQSEDDGLAF